ncbi:hybrid sensor histidine kinase/response regulator [Croceibacter atlanticus]|jgi:signal transduction histidine kinase/FixJ family two-component response regulator|uniref:histidine kinase n=2 Tax=Croceibacter TaxID=216431 RepID=A3U574_CROAH|nr:ATP-binding protein [Croceibacter atlanticus]EAP87391.1 two-component system sensor histidine kinase [Croceibacter atlanticus HTCC2559]
MDKTKNRFTFKIILSYVTLGVLALVVGFFLYSEFKFLLKTNTTTTEDEKFIETGTLINQVYETDGFSRLALLTGEESDFELYQQKADSLFNKIEEIKTLTDIQFQKQQLDYVKELLLQKTKNIEQLRILKLTNSKDSSFDDIAEEFNKLESSMGKLTVETFINNPNDLTERERRIWSNYVEYLNQSEERDTATVKTKVVDSMITATRFILAEAKRENSKSREALQQKENELIRNDLNISAQLRQIITAFDAEIARKNQIQATKKSASVDRTSTILKYSGVLGIFIILLFTYIILNDFFKAERFKISLKKSKDYSEELLKSREQLISTVSHDLKTPLNTIVGYSDLIENTDLTEKQLYYVNQITNSSLYVTKLVDDLLDFSKLEAGKLHIETIPFSLESIIQQTVETSKDVHQQKNVAIHLYVDQAISNQVFESDPLRIRQILSNLIGNAFKFTEEGSVTVYAKILEQKAQEFEIEIKVVDTGIGISKEKQELIFKEFQQAEADTIKRFGGNGLGLAISRKLTNLLHGTLTVDSTPNQGSTFTLVLPLKLSESKLKSEITTLTKAVKSLTVVVIDDDTSMTKLLEELFGQMNITCHSFNAFEDFVASQNFEYDFVLTDVEMPKTNGFQVLEQLKRHFKANYNGQPIVAMTGSREYTVRSFKEQGFSGLLHKPFPKEKLYSALNQLFPEHMGIPIKIESEKETTQQSTLFNLSLLNSFLSTEDALEEVLFSFYNEVNIDLQRMALAVKTEDYTAVNDIAHKMLTLTRQLEAKEVVKILDVLEYVTQENLRQETLTSLFNSLQEKVENLVTALKNR